MNGFNRLIVDNLLDYDELPTDRACSTSLLLPLWIPKQGNLSWAVKCRFEELKKISEEKSWGALL